MNKGTVVAALIVMLVGMLVAGPFGLSVAKAQLGQTRSQCDVRYGSPVEENDTDPTLDLFDKNTPKGHRCLYSSNNDVWIEIDFAGTNSSAICWSISYRKPLDQTFSDDDINRFLNANSEGHRWVKTAVNLRGQEVSSNNTFAVLAIGSVVYSNATIRRVTPASATIFHSTGVTTAPLENLSPELQTQFGYERERAYHYRNLELVKDLIDEYWIRDDYADASRIKSGSLIIQNYKERRSN